MCVLVCVCVRYRMITGFYTVVSPVVCIYCCYTVCVYCCYCAAVISHSRDQTLLVLMSKGPLEDNQQRSRGVCVCKSWEECVCPLKLNTCLILMSLITLFILVSSWIPDYVLMCTWPGVCATNNPLPNYTPSKTWLFTQHKWHQYTFISLSHTHIHTQYQSSTKAAFLFFHSSIHFKKVPCTHFPKPLDSKAGSWPCCGVFLMQDWPFDDGAPPPSKVVEDWLSLLRRRFMEEPGCCVAVHCVAGLGRSVIHPA